ncbi:hypothetical protein IFM89_027701 [Coptis chinensis]|uniref:Cytochrome P450 71A1 n=1 Tax=Coptis chinensis TaxID=261450 RepID=A0A835HYU7_9MAGN|nr:hypothetical protein IFM89_027701 [Coptis chinensis]
MCVLVLLWFVGGVVDKVTVEQWWYTLAVHQVSMESLQSNLPFFLVAAIFLLPLLYSLLIKNPNETQGHGKSKKLHLPPGPTRLPIIGNLHQLGNSPHLSLSRLSEKFGAIFYLQLGHIPTVIVSSARLAKEVMTTHDLTLSSRPQLYSAKHLFYNCTDVAFAPYGAYWRHLRNIYILELLSAKRVQSFSFIREKQVARLINRVAASYPGTTNLTKILGLYSNDVLCEAAFGRDFSEGGEYDQHGFQKMLEEYQILLGGFSVGDYFPSMEWMNTLTGMKSRLVKTFRPFDHFFNKGGTHGIALTMDNIKAVILNMFAAGTDTTFITLDWGMTELVMNRKAMKKVQTEIRNFMGERTVVLESNLPQLHYLKAVIKEIFRLHPPAPILVPRESMEDVVIDGYDIPTKTRIFINVWAIGRDPESWENPHEYEPERFMRSSIDFRGQDFELIPFDAGRRSCPAITFGIATVELALAQLLHSFDWKLPPGIETKDLDMTEVFGISMHRVSNLIVVTKPHFTNII